MTIEEFIDTLVFTRTVVAALVIGGIIVVCVYKTRLTRSSQIDLKSHDMSRDISMERNSIENGVTRTYIEKTRYSPRTLCSPRDCILSLVSSADVTAGQAVVLKLELRNDNQQPIRVDSSMNFVLKSRDTVSNEHSDIQQFYRKLERESLEEIHDRNAGNVRFIKWIPLISGKRSFDVLINGERAGNEPCEVTVIAGSLDKILETDETKRHSCYTKQQQTISVIGLHKYGNRLSFTDQWSLQWRAYGEDIDDFCAVQLKSLQFCFDEPGIYYAVKLQHNSDECVQLPEEYTYRVYPNPADDSTEEVYFETPQLEAGKLKLMIMEGLSWSKLIGDDGVNVVNMNRVLNSYPVELRFDDFTIIDQQLCIDISKFVSQTDKIEELLCLLMKGLYYRKKSSKLNEEREQWKREAKTAYEEKRHDQSKKYKALKEKCGKEMEVSNHKASNAIFQFYNYDRSEKEIDLHGQLVADDEKLEEYRRQLLERDSEQSPNQIIENERKKMDEALRHLQHHLDVTESRDIDWLEIIVGAGNHSKDRRQKIRPKVEEFLKKRRIKYQECNKGSLLVTYKEYKGVEPCFANFYCKHCEKPWGSKDSWRGFWQMCYRCDGNGIESKCYPLKMRPKSFSTQRRGGNPKKRMTREEHRRLCQKCQDTEMDCSLLE